MRELTLIVQTSLDGFVAGPNGEFDHFIGGEENLEFVCSLTEDADVALFGRISFELLDSNWPIAATKSAATKNEIKYSNWYNAVDKFVLSKTAETKNISNTYIISKDIKKEINDIKQKPGKNILIFGSPTASNALFKLNLIDSFWIIVHPVIFGRGIPFLKESGHITKLELAVLKQLSNGTLCSKYLVKK